MRLQLSRALFGALLWVFLWALPGVAWAAPYAPLLGNAALEAALLALTNEARAEAGLEALEPDPDLAQTARHHAAEMADRGYFSHTSPVAENATLARRVAKGGSFIRTLGENLALVGGTDPAQASTVGWLESPGHRANLLHPRFTHVGFGSAPYPDGRVAVAQVLGYQPATLRRVELVSVPTEVPLLDTTVSLAAPGEIAVFYGERSSPLQTLGAGQHTLRVPLSEPPPRPLAVQLGLRGGASESFVLQDDGWLGADGWQRSRAVSGAQAQLLGVTLSTRRGRGLELRLRFADAPAVPLAAWQGGALLPLEQGGTQVTVQLAATDEPVYVGEPQPDGRYTTVYSFHPDTRGAPRVLPALTGETTGETTGD